MTTNRDRFWSRVKKQARVIHALSPYIFVQVPLPSPEDETEDDEETVGSGIAWSYEWPKVPDDAPRAAGGYSYQESFEITPDVAVHTTVEWTREHAIIRWHSTGASHRMLIASFWDESTGHNLAIRNLGRLDTEKWEEDVGSLGFDLMRPWRLELMLTPLRIFKWPEFSSVHAGDN